VKRYLEYYVSEEGEVDDKLTLSSEGFACLTEDLEDLIDKYTGIEDVGFMRCGMIRESVIDLIDEVLEEKEKGK
jgi:hypothetical protein|tara:strand:+ start:399 stop:620 length:222 start_codon:yes stop_codon:yes gene_type:complete